LNFEESEIEFNNLQEILANTVKEVPDRIFLKEGEGDNLRTLTYKEFQEKTYKCANMLATLGVKKGDFVGVQMTNSIEFVLIMYGCYHIGAISTPLISLWKAREVDEAINRAKIETIIIKSSIKSSVKKASKNSLIKNIILIGDDAHDGVDHIAGKFKDLMDAADSSVPDVKVSKEDLATCHFTSGTTGNSKGVLHNHLGYTYTALVHARTFKFQKPLYAILLLPLYHIFGFSVIHSAVYLKGTVVLMSKFVPEQILEKLLDPELTFFAGTPSIFNMLMAYEGVEKYTISDTNEVWVSGAGKLAKRTEKAVNEKLLKGKGVLCNAYGGTEDVATGTTTFNDPKEGTIGEAMIGCNIEVVDDEGNVLPAGKENIGMLVNQSPAIFQGYLGDPKAADPVDHNLSDPVLKSVKDRDGIWYWSGDMAYQDEKGWFYLTDRAKDIIKSAERLVYPSEVEDVLLNHPEVKEIAVIGVPHDIYGESIMAVVVPERKDVDEAKLEEELKVLGEKELAKYKVPRIWMYKPSLQTNTLGKVLKRKYREQYVSKMARQKKKAEKNK
jgi:long-chain acyl-CoA synthetase